MEQKQKNHLDELVSNAEDYLKTRQELSKLVALQKTSAVAAGLFSSIVIFLLFFFVVVFASVAIAYLISLYTGKVYLGFLSVSVLYLLAALIVHSRKKTLLEKPVINAMIKNFFKDHDED